MTDDRAAVLCGFVADNDAPIEGSTKEYCELCAAEVWMSPTSRKWRDEGAQIMCIPCGVGVMQTEADPKLQMPTAEQLAELREHRKKDR